MAYTKPTQPLNELLPVIPTQETEQNVNLQNHIAADVFPMMETELFRELKQDIQKHGQQVPILICDGLILDGRNRAKACLELGITPIVEEHNGDPWDIVWSCNAMRRDLVAEQRYLIWRFCHEQKEEFQSAKRRIAENANLRRGAAIQGRERKENGTLKANYVVQRNTAPECDAIEQSVEMRNGEPVTEQNVPSLDISPKEDHPAKKLKAKLSKTNAGAVSRGDLLATVRPDLAERVRMGTMKPAEAHRQMKNDLAPKKTKLLPQDKYTVIYADPPWTYNNSKAVQGDDGSENASAKDYCHSMSLAALKALDVPLLAAPNAVLFLWATCPLLVDALELCVAWGFTYKAQFVWDKVKHNMGHYNSVRHEVLLICTKGSCTPENVKLFDSVQTIERTEYGTKPNEFRKIIETLYPSGKKIELFPQSDAPAGWSMWRNEMSS